MHTKTALGDSSASYKGVLILGSDNSLPPNIRELYERKGFLLLGDGKTPLQSLDYDKLKGKIDANTRIYIYAHGRVANEAHTVDRWSTKSLLEKLASCSNDIAHLNIQLNSCYAGAAAPYVETLPPGSVLVAYGMAEAVTSVDLSFKTLEKSNQFIPELSAHTLIDDFVHRFALHARQTGTISIKKKDGTVFEYTIRLPKKILTNPEEVVRYLDDKRKKFIDKYHKEFEQRFDVTKLPKISNMEALDWARDNFIFRVFVKDEALYDALIREPFAYDDFIENSVGQSILLLAASLNHYRMVEALLHSSIDLIKYQNKEGKTAFMIAAAEGHVNTIKTTLNSEKVTAEVLHITDKDGNTALMLAAMNGHSEAIEHLLASNKVDTSLANKTNKHGRTALMLASTMGNVAAVKILLHEKIDLNAKDSDGNTALMLAVTLNKPSVVQALLESDQIELNLINKGGKTAFSLARELGHSEIALAIMRKKMMLLKKQHQQINQELLDVNTEDKEVTRLKLMVEKVIEEYIKHFGGIAHHHGASGLLRADKLLTKILLMQDIHSVKKELMEYLKDKTKGNTHSHSFRTMLLQSLLENNVSLKDISNNYKTQLKNLWPTEAPKEQSPKVNDLGE